MGLQYNEGNLTFPAGAAIPCYSVVKLHTDGTILVAAAADANAIGTTLREAFAIGDLVPVRLLCANGTHIMVASEAITVGAVVNQAASGKVQTSGGTVKLGYAKTASGADGNWIEVIPKL